MRHSVWIAVIALAGCAQLGPLLREPTPTDPAPATDAEDSGGESLSAVPVPPRSARTAEQFDTTSAAQRAEAAAPATGAEGRRLGSTIASLGDPAQPGFWLETPLVEAEAAGRVVYQGQSAAVTLRPIPGAATAGSRLSLAAMRLLGIALTDLPEIDVYQQ